MSSHSDEDSEVLQMFFIYTDGAFWNKTTHGAYSFTCYRNGTWSNFFSWCPAGSSFDTEIVAIEEAVQWACIQNLDGPLFFIDNKAALSSFLNTSDPKLGCATSQKDRNRTGLTPVATELQLPV